MAVPKRKTSKSKIRHRVASWARKHKVAFSRPCESCGEAAQPHRVCPACGTYKGRQVLTINTDEE